MTGQASWTIDEPDPAFRCGLEPHQLTAVAEPRRPTQDLAGDQPGGNFNDLESLLEQLGTAPIIELGNPLPLEKFMPRRGVGRCPAAHNRALLGDQDN